MDERLEDRIARAKELLKTVRHAAIATVNEDGTPHNTPVFFIYDHSLEYIYWGSSPKAQHTKNIMRSGDIFVVLYEANVGGGLFIKAEEAHEVTESELDEALALHNEFRTARHKDPLNRAYYADDSPQRMYKAKTQRFWVNLAQRDVNGNIIRDYRHEIRKEQLL